jgi:hypothetical protein
MSNAIIRPITTPSTAALPPCRFDRNVVSASNAVEIGTPSTRMNSPPTMMVVTSGITMIGMIGRTTVGTGRRLIHRAR